MDEVIVESSDELELIFSKYRNGFLFRGQTSHYTDSNKNVNIPTSFSRHGCIPPLMFKWSHYSKAILRAFGGMDYNNIDLGLSQAILQHYGWRSFFVDLTKSTHIACWFAANKYKENRQIYMCENIEENPVWLVHRKAIYTESNQPGHVYIIDTKLLESENIKIHDLTEIDTEGYKLRFNAQSACMVGNLKNNLPPKCVVAHLEVDHAVLVDYYNNKDINSTSDVFPDRNEDFILHSLLDIPWKDIPSESPIPIYRRGLELPEYDAVYTKHLTPSVTLFSEFWIADNRGGPGSVFNEVPFFLISEEAYYGSNETGTHLPKITELLNEYNGIVVELSGLIHIPEMTGSSEYEKGIFVEKISDEIVSVSGLVVDHPGHVIAGFGTNVGWYYKVDGFLWSKVEHDEQCPCNNDLRHELQFSLLRVLDMLIDDEKIVKEGDLKYRQKDIGA